MMSPQPDLCVAALKLRRQQRAAGRARAENARRNTGLVVTTRYGTPIEPGNVSRSFDRCIASAGVLGITVHGTRTTCGSLLAAVEVHPRVAMQILRYGKIAVTMGTCSDVPSAATRDALRKLRQWPDSDSRA